MTSWGSGLGKPPAVVRRKRSLITLARKYTELQELGGRRFIGPCPFHNDTNPSFVVYAENRQDEHFHCFGCNAHGDAIDFVRLIQGCSFEEAVQIACTKGDVDEELLQRMTPKKSLDDERAVAELLLAERTRQMWARLPKKLWPKLNKLAALVAAEVQKTNDPIDLVHSTFKKALDKLCNVGV